MKAILWLVLIHVALVLPVLAGADPNPAPKGHAFATCPATLGDVKTTATVTFGAPPGGAWTAVTNGAMPFFRAEIVEHDLLCFYGAGDGHNGVSISLSAPSGTCTASGRSFYCQ